MVNIKNIGGTKRVERIAVCGNCNGFGVIVEYNQMNPMDEPKDVTCTRCNGSGRVRLIITIEEEPYKNHKSER